MMASQLDLDQGGTLRTWALNSLGPSVGSVWGPVANVLSITAAGTYALDRSTSVVEVNTTGSVTITLPSAVTPSYGGAGTTQPTLFVNNPVVIVDIGGNAQASPITIQPKSGAETIMGLTSIQITVNFGGYTLQPIPAAATWNSISP